MEKAIVHGAWMLSIYDDTTGKMVYPTTMYVVVSEEMSESDYKATKNEMEKIGKNSYKINNKMDQWYQIDLEPVQKIQPSDFFSSDSTGPVRPCRLVPCELFGIKKTNDTKVPVINLNDTKDPVIYDLRKKSGIKTEGIDLNIVPDIILSDYNIERCSDKVEGIIMRLRKDQQQLLRAAMKKSGVSEIADYVRQKLHIDV